jgi:excisionase family DNA binding protein
MLRRRGLEDLALFMESVAKDLEAEIYADGGDVRGSPCGEGDKPLVDYTVAQVADMFQRSPQTVRDWIHSGRLGAYKLNGREYRITQAAVEDFIEQQRNGDTDRQTNGRENSADLRAWRGVYRPAVVP